MPLDSAVTPRNDTVWTATSGIHTSGAVQLRADGAYMCCMMTKKDVCNVCSPHNV